MSALLRTTATKTGAQVAVYVQPRASRNEIVGVHDGALKVRLAAPPVDGAANGALIELLADVFDLPRSAITIVAGQSGRRKMVAIEGRSVADVSAAVPIR